MVDMILVAMKIIVIKLTIANSLHNLLTPGCIGYSERKG